MQATGIDALRPITTFESPFRDVVSRLVLSTPPPPRPPSSNERIVATGDAIRAGVYA